MADSTTELCDDEITQKRMRSFFGTLSEKDQRRYAALEAQRLGARWHEVCLGNVRLFDKNH